MALVPLTGASSWRLESWGRLSVGTVIFQKGVDRLWESCRVCISVADGWQRGHRCGWKLNTFWVNHAAGNRRMDRGAVKDRLPDVPVRRFGGGTVNAKLTGRLNRFATLTMPGQGGMGHIRGCVGNGCLLPEPLATSDRMIPAPVGGNALGTPSRRTSADSTLRTGEAMKFKIEFKCDNAAFCDSDGIWTGDTVGRGSSKSFVGSLVALNSVAELSPPSRARRLTRTATPSARGR